MLPRHCLPLPLVVLFADRAWRAQVASMIAADELPADVPADFGYVTDPAENEAQERLADLVPNAKHGCTLKSGRPNFRLRLHVTFPALVRALPMRQQFKIRPHDSPSGPQSARERGCMLRLNELPGRALKGSITSALLGF
jgi:hypothetical protein